jgi:hypothetical protein
MCELSKNDEREKLVRARGVSHILFTNTVHRPDLIVPSLLWIGRQFVKAPCRMACISSPSGIK